MDRDRQTHGAHASLRYRSCARSALLVCAIVLAGCQPQLLRDRQVFLPPQTPHIVSIPASEIVGDAPGTLGQAEALLVVAKEQEEKGVERCVDLYYRAALQSWRQLESWPAPAVDPGFQATAQIYQQSLGRLIITASRYGRLDPRGRLIVVDAGQRRAVPIAYYGFPWKPQEFSQVFDAGDFQTSDIARRYRTAGLGTPLVAVRPGCRQDPFSPPRQHFPVTAVLRPASSVQGAMDGSVVSDSSHTGAVLEFYNPCLFNSLPVGAKTVGMERDLTAPLACLLEDTPRKFTEGFLDPNDADVRPQLFMMTPYQRGKIPVVFIHGLWSDPVTWVDAVNDLRAQGDIDRQYQFWFFRYPTGRGLLESAAELREKLLLARASSDPASQDAAMDKMVLVGHSMGGLVAKLQVTQSYDILWRHAANAPLETVRTTPAIRERLRRIFFFEPLPMVRRVVFIGTPHRGSNEARRLVGRLASSLVRISAPEEARYKQLVDSNRDIFAEYLWEAWPTTVDLLEPSNPMLQAIGALSFAPCTRLHSIIGTGGLALIGEPNDGVVPVSSARQTGVCSERFVPVRHAQLHRDAVSVSDVLRILREHAQEPG